MRLILSDKMAALLMPFGGELMEVADEYTGTTNFRELKLRAPVTSQDIAGQVAVHTCRYWYACNKIVHRVRTIAYFEGLGAPRLL
jgi:hypothetical protein